jgi:nanoRNase/pAp phosphatase (c-di-AMP/oligoRNAs hydrolase)
MHFNGGGHAYASGGRTELSLEDTIELFKNVVINFLPNE